MYTHITTSLEMFTNIDRQIGYIIDVFFFLLDLEIREAITGKGANE